MAVKSVFDIKCFKDVKFWVEQSSIAIILMGKRELIALLNLSSWCLVMVERLFLAVPRGCLQFVIVVLPDHTHLLFFTLRYIGIRKHFLKYHSPPPPPPCASKSFCLHMCYHILHFVWKWLAGTRGGKMFSSPKTQGLSPQNAFSTK